MFKKTTWPNTAEKLRPPISRINHSIDSSKDRIGLIQRPKSTNASTGNHSDASGE